ncbi:hypothetical protein SAMN05443633_107111 [Chryseobacterium arachidis]|uniref:Uncharacterized protein n=1 Tax=Chryseobacterium arachidis TaxID=1416778 RepID=A0A1M5EYY0_9FLAO|nr:hypothetical protein [Chryseobacterium arachidis]SHF84483.1 hypothetical protein SAMN05443633_107111 [Chryseobacterium arachidis]
MTIKKFFAIIALYALFNCTDNKKSIPTTNKNIINTDRLQQTEPKPIDAKSEVQTNLEQLKTEASRLSGGGSIKTVELENGKAVITYVKSYKEYKDLNPQSGLTKNDLKSYWSTGNAIQKMLVGSPARLMKKLDFINEVKIILPFENKVYQIDITKSELEKFVGKSISEIENDWVKSFADPYIYDKKGREKFLKQFGTIKNN